MVPILLALLALLDLRVELQLLADHFSWLQQCCCYCHRYCITTAKGHSKNSSDYFN